MIMLIGDTMKYKILSILCVLCLLTGCKVELPPQSAASSLPQTVSSSAVSSAQDESALSSAVSGQSVASSVISSSVSSKTNNTVTSKPTSSKPAASQSPAASKAAAPAEQSKERSCTLLISCSDILKNKDKFSADQLSIVPENGLIYEKSSISFQDGDTVFDVLVRETKANNIQMEYVASPVYQTNYIKGIDNIYEKSFGSNSGWMFAVNGKQPPVGSSSYKLKSGDKIQWLYVCGQ